MKKNIAIVILLLTSILSLSYAYVQKSEADDARLMAEEMRQDRRGTERGSFEATENSGPANGDCR